MTIADELPDEAPPPPRYEPWSPSQHPIEASVVDYQPGQKLIYERRNRWTPAAVMVVSTVLLAWLAGTLFGHVRFWVLATCALMGSYVLMLWKSGDLRDIRWEFAFEAKSLRILSGDEEFAYDLSKATAVILQLEEQEQWWSSSLSGVWQRYRYARYNAQILLEGVIEDSDLVVANTGFIQLDPPVIQHIGQCFGASLAEAMGVPFRDESGHRGFAGREHAPSPDT